jgi:hypothetical protein
MIPRIALRPARPGAFRPALLIETVPWLMLAAALRVVFWHRGLAAFPAEIAANAAIFIALLLAARRMIEFTGGTTQLGYLSLRDQLVLAYRVLHPVGLLIVGLYMGLAFIGMVVRHEQGQRPSMLGALRDLAARWKYLLAGIVAAALFQILLSPVQGLVRWWVYLFWTGTEAPELLKAMVYFTFIFGFATLRLWGTVAILIFALREAYRRSVPTPAAGNS